MVNLEMWYLKIVTLNNPPETGPCSTAGASPNNIFTQAAEQAALYPVPSLAERGGAYVRDL